MDRPIILPNFVIIDDTLVVDRNRVVAVDRPSKEDLEQDPEHKSYLVIQSSDTETFQTFSHY